MRGTRAGKGAKPRRRERSTEGPRGAARKAIDPQDAPPTSYVVETQRLLRRLVGVQDAGKAKAMRPGRVRASSRGPALRFTAEWEGNAGAARRDLERRPSLRVEKERTKPAGRRDGGRRQLEAWRGKDIRIREQYLELLRESLTRKLAKELPSNRGRSGSMVLPALKLPWGDARGDSKRENRSRSVDFLWESERDNLAGLLDDDDNTGVELPAAGGEHAAGELAAAAPARSQSPMTSPLPRGSPLGGLGSPLAGLDGHSQRQEMTSGRLMELVASVAATISLREAGVTKGDRIVMDLSRRHLSSVPVEAYLLVPPISDLVLTKNALQSLPAEVDRWSSLVKLRVDRNCLESLPAGICVCGQLVELNCSGNRLSSLPPSFTSLTSLATLLLSSNRFEELPPPLSNSSLLTRLAMRENRLSSVRGVAHHPALQSLSLLHNAPLSCLPLELGTCSALHLLEYDPSVRFPPSVITQQGLSATLAFLSRIHASLQTKAVALPSELLPDLGVPVCQEPSLVSLDVSDNLLSTLPPEIRLLSNLRSLNAAHNHLSSLPSALGLLPALTSLDLSNNALPSLPPSLGSILSLSSLQLHGNRLRFLPLPFAHLSALSALSLHQNPLSIPPPDVVAAGPRSVVRYLNGLRAKVLGMDVAISGANLKYFPSFLVTKGMPIELIRTARVSDGGDRDDEFAEQGASVQDEWWTDRWTAVDSETAVMVGGGVDSLSLDGNQLRALPDAASGQYLVKAEEGGGKLVRLNYGLNEIGSLTYLSVRGNLLTEVPPSVACLTHLRTLILDNNLIKTWNEDPGQPVSALSSLTLLSLNTNELIQVPKALGNLSNLEALTLDSNHIKVLPEFTTTLQSLTSLSLNANALSELPPYIQALSRLQDLRFASNQITELPSELFKISSLTQIRASSNQLESIPKAISFLKRLASLSLSHNALTHLPPALANMPMLSHVSLHSNPQLPPTLPPGMLDSSLSHLKSYLRRLSDTDKALDLSGLSLSLLPLNVFHNIHLHELKLSDNNLSSLPSQVTDLVHLRTLDLSNNQFVELPEGLLWLSHLTDLGLKGNPLPNLHPQILEQGSAAVLDYLRRVRRSKLTQRLDLASLSLTSIPPHVLTLVFVEDLSFEGNQLSSIPDHLCWELPNLTRLNLRRNALQTPLPLMLGRMSRLTALDLAQNQLTSFPVGIGKLEKLRFLGWGGNPVKLPPVALLGHGVPAVLNSFGKLVESGCGMALSQFHRSVAPKKKTNAVNANGGEADDDVPSAETTGLNGQRGPSDNEYVGLIGVDGTELGPYAKPDDFDCVLVGEGSRRAMSLTEAMEAAQPNETVLLRPGRHVVSLAFKQAGVTLAGDGTVEECIIEGKGDKLKGVITCLAANCRLYNLTISYLGSVRESGAVFVSNGSLNIINCALSNVAGMGIWVRAGADVHITGCRIQGCGGPGVMLESRVHAEIKYSDIVKCKGPGVKAVEGSNPLIEANRIIGGSACGVMSATKGLGVIRRNEIHQHRGAGVEIRSLGNPVVEGNTLSKNLVGILCAESGCGKLLDNTIADNKKAGIAVTGASQVECINNNVKGNKDSTGLLLREESKVVVREHEVHGVGNGIVVTDGARVRVEGSRVIHVGKEAMRVTGAGSLLDAHANQIFGNSLHGFHVLTGGEGRLTNNEIYFNGGTGVLVDEECTGSMSSNDVHDNARGDVISNSHERRFVIE